MNAPRDPGILILSCPECGHTLRLQRQHLGILGRCVSCRTEIMGLEVSPGLFQAVRSTPPCFKASTEQLKNRVQDPCPRESPLPPDANGSKVVGSADSWGFQEAVSQLLDHSSPGEFTMESSENQPPASATGNNHGEGAVTINETSATAEPKIQVQFVEAPVKRETIPPAPEATPGGQLLPRKEIQPAFKSPNFSSGSSMFTTDKSSFPSPATKDSENESGQSLFERSFEPTLAVPQSSPTEFAQSFLTETESATPTVPEPTPERILSVTVGPVEIEKIKLKQSRSKKPGLSPAETWAVALGVLFVVGFGVLQVTPQERREKWSRQVHDFIEPGSVVLEKLPFGQGNPKAEIHQSMDQQEPQSPNATVEVTGDYR